MVDLQNRILGDIQRAYPEAEPYEMREILRTAQFLGGHSRARRHRLLPRVAAWSLGADWEVHVAAELMAQRPWERPHPRPVTDA
ncbi:hypothetical protein LY71_109177 [Geodermatophilus tzadiensis]|uniref:Uncharacterized protein n=1 Tax=Geodermatophilus tzadiensis TaxID=1137988 RepID=A0A2T0TSE1_9ACTN|nr:hypothetical protein [Geodermatophilus tzadiensis]PRY48540.1 hypothetical protein LY71_109177 [Geodermatophilus tzadiensis]